MRMLRWASVKTRLDPVRNVDIWKEAHVYPMAEMAEDRKHWHVMIQAGTLRSVEGVGEVR